MSDNQLLKKEITLGQAIAILVTLVTTVFGAWINMRINVSKIEVKILEVEKNVEDSRANQYKHYEKLDSKLDQLIYQTNELKVQLQNKEDRK